MNAQVRSTPAAPRVLIVDDEPRILQILRRTLRWEHAEVFTAPNAYVALELMEADPVDLVISDAMMPGIGGVQMLAQMRKSWPDTVRVMLTSVTAHELALDALSQGAIFRFLNKPWDNADLVTTVREALAYRAQRLELRSLGHEVERRHSALDALVDVVACGRH